MQHYRLKLPQYFANSIHYTCTQRISQYHKKKVTSSLVCSSVLTQKGIINKNVAKDKSF